MLHTYIVCQVAESMIRWLSLFRAVVIKPLPNQVVEDIDAEPDDVAEEQDPEISALLVPGEPCCKKPGQ